MPCIVGPTGAGKTAAALSLAGVLPVSVINADSRQLYRDFPIITAQPLPEERAVCPHLLYGFLPTSQKLGAGEYIKAADLSIEKAAARKRLPLVVGGTGLYFKALLDGIAPIPPVPEEIRRFWQERLNMQGSHALHGLLVEHDPEYAAKIHPNDKQRITRALEVFEATGKSFTWWHGRAAPQRPYRACKVGIEMGLAELEHFLVERIRAMLERGALEEARAALEVCNDPSAPGWSGIGCAEVYRYLTGTLSLEQCREAWFRNTRAYAKRQLTWFRADRDIHWFAPHETRRLRDYVLRSLGTYT